MEWLCVLSGNKLDHYLEAWQYAHRGQEEWAELRTVLPYEFFEDRDKFIQTAPIYLKKFPKVSEARKLAAEPDLRKLVDTIRQTNYSFMNLLGAFRQLHKDLSYTPDKKGGLDFREHRPLDSYAVVAFRAETCLRERLEHVGLLESIPVRRRALEGYMRSLSKHSGLSQTAQGWFDKYASLAQLHDTPPDAIDRIRSIETNLEESEHEIVQALLATCLARNYFAHHRYLDHELLRSDNSAFVLGGIVLTVLYLLT